MAISWHPWLPGRLKLDSILSLFECVRFALPVFPTKPFPLKGSNHLCQRKLLKIGSRVFWRNIITKLSLTNPHLLSDLTLTSQLKRFTTLSGVWTVLRVPLSCWMERRPRYVYNALRHLTFSSGNSLKPFLPLPDFSF